MKIVIVGPTHPYKGGIAQHTTELALRLAHEGHEVVLESWRHQYPARLYPGQLTVDDEDRDVAPFEHTRHRLTWYNPLTWIAAGRRAKRADLVVVAHSNPFQIPAHVTMLRSARRIGSRPRRVLVAHNVMPHEPTIGSRWLLARLRRATDGVLVHSDEETRRASSYLPGVRAVQHALPPFGPSLTASDAAPKATEGSGATAHHPIRLLALGFLRAYKGLDVLLEAARHAPGVTVTIRGECWDDELRATLEQLASTPELAGRVDFTPGYVDADEISMLFAAHDLAVLPYLEATGSQNVLLAFAHGVPAIVSDLSTLANAVTHDVDGLILPAGDLSAWTTALAALDHSDVDRWRVRVPRPDADGAWHGYCSTLTNLAASTASSAASNTERGRHIVSEESSRVTKADRIRTLLEPHLPATGARVLDAGCGSGHIAQRLGTTLDRAEVVGLDVADSRMVRDGHRFVASSGASMPFPDASFDAVVSNHVLEHVGTFDEQAAYLAEVRRVIAPTGIVYLAVPNRFRLVEAHFSLPLLSWFPSRVANAYVRWTRRGTWYDVRPPTRRQLMRMLTSAGFDIDDRTPAAARAAVGRIPVAGRVLGRIPTACLRPLLLVVPTFVALARPRTTEGEVDTRSRVAT